MAHTQARLRRSLSVKRTASYEDVNPSTRARLPLPAVKRKAEGNLKVKRGGFRKLGVLTQWNVYDKPPWRMFIHAMLLIVVTVQIVFLAAEEGHYLRNSEETFYRFFFPVDMHNDAGTRPSFLFHNLTGLVEHIDHVRDVYYTFTRQSVDHYEYVRTESGREIPIEMVVATYTREVFDEHMPDYPTVTQAYSIMPTGDLGPFTTDEDHLRALVDNLAWVKMQLLIENINFGPYSPVCLQWGINLSYERGSGGGSFRLSLGTDRKLCHRSHVGNWDSRPFSQFLWLALVVVVLSFCSLYHSVRELYAHLKWYLAWRTFLRGRASLSFRQQRKFFDMWILVSVFAALFNIIASSNLLHIIISLSYFTTGTRLCLATGGLLTWIDVTRYFSASRKSYMLVKTLSKGIKRAGRLMWTTLPLFIAFAVLFVSIWGMYADVWHSIDFAAVTMFSILNGDTIEDVYRKTVYPSPLLSRVFITLFLMLFMYVVLNMFIFVVHDAYFSVIAHMESAEERQKERSERQASRSERREVAADVDAPSADDDAKDARDAEDAEDAKDTKDAEVPQHTSPRRAVSMTEPARDPLDARAGHVRAHSMAASPRKGRLARTKSYSVKFDRGAKRPSSSSSSSSSTSTTSSSSTSDAGGGRTAGVFWDALCESLLGKDAGTGGSGSANSDDAASTAATEEFDGALSALERELDELAGAGVPLDAAAVERTVDAYVELVEHMHKLHLERMEETVRTIVERHQLRERGGY